MKKIKLLILFVAVSMIFTACFEDPGTDITWEGGAFVEFDVATTPSGGRSFSYLRLNDGTTYESGFNVLRVATDASSDVTVDFTIESTSTAIEGVHYTVSGTSATIASGSWVQSLPIQILADNMNPGEAFTLDITLTNSSIGLGDRVSATATISIQCPSELAGLVDYEMISNAFGGPNVTGTMEWIEGANGVYTWDTYTFGSYQTQYGCCEQGRTSVLSVSDVCSTLSIASADAYGCDWSLTVDSVNGAEMIATVTGGCVKGYTMRFTRQDGATWNIIP